MKELSPKEKKNLLKKKTFAFALLITTSLANYMCNKYVLGHMKFTFFLLHIEMTPSKHLNIWFT